MGSFGYRNHFFIAQRDPIKRHLLYYLKTLDNLLDTSKSLYSRSSQQTNFTPWLVLVSLYFIFLYLTS